MIIELIIEPTDGRLQRHLESTAGIGVHLYFPKILCLKAIRYCNPPLGLPISSPCVKQVQAHVHCESYSVVHLH
jgi:hypothetical protein